jgi:serine/threonine-protein kinase
MAVMYQHVQGKAAPLNELNPSLPKEVCDVVGKAMAVDKMKRHASMEELHRALDETVPALVA